MKIKHLVKNTCQTWFSAGVLALLLAFSNNAAALERNLDNGLPMYGTVIWTTQDRKEISDYLAYVDTIYTNRQAAARDVNADGWDAYIDGNQPEAMRLFNLSWLLNNENMDTYSGFVRILSVDKKYKAAIEVGELALALGSKDSEMMTGLAVSYAYYAADFGGIGNEAYFARAHSLIDLAESLPTSCDVCNGERFFVAMLDQDYKQAKSIREAAALAGNPLTQESIEWLEAFLY